jgi:hypothetical protein
MNEVLYEPELERRRSVSQSALDGMPQFHAVMDDRDHSNAHHPLPDGTAIAQINRKPKEQHQVNDAVPVLEKIQFDIDMLLARAVNEANSEPLSSRIRSVS